MKQTGFSIIAGGCEFLYSWLIQSILTEVGNRQQYSRQIQDYGMFNIHNCVVSSQRLSCVDPSFVL